MYTFTKTPIEKKTQTYNQRALIPKLRTPSFTWIKVRKGPDDKVQRRDSQQQEQQELEADDPLHSCQVDAEQPQQDGQGNAPHCPDVAEAQHIRDGLRKARDVHGTCNTLKDSSL